MYLKSKEKLFNNSFFCVIINKGDRMGNKKNIKQTILCAIFLLIGVLGLIL